ncbi:Tyrosine-protein kinase transmembrane receptor Ror [Holothuria leucospilota]|uniref:Tyrosine-protein kinase transmembrane receptor Ror n=1 Tax=Holothuria leucospilota TaxID=206669 RepID=A0A9Q1C1T7_HOLLE|nr:Tyrosine-protein kinase transmembrane receptor Ror [Holothuria leucospilota]
MELQSLWGNDTHRTRTFFRISGFIILFFTYPLQGSEVATIGSETTRDMFNDCDTMCNAIGTGTVECMGGSCECMEPGYYAMFNASLQGYDCIDNDECSSGLNNCDQTSSDCENTVGSFTCTCKVGYNKTTTDACEDIDECSENSHTCDSITSNCKNTLGSYECDCKPGFSSNGSDGVCTNINECLMDPPPCDISIQNCTDTTGSYECTCLDGTTSCESCKIGSIDCVILVCVVILILIIVAVLLTVIILRVRRSRKTPPSPPTRNRTADVELVHAEPEYNHTIVPEPVLQGTSNVAALLISKKNVHMESKLIGEGVIEYYKATLTLPDQQERAAVVKTIAETSSSGISTLIINEVERLSLLPSHAYIVELLGWCDTAPPYIIFEFINGSSLLAGLEEGQVKVSNGTNIALQVARGMKFLSEKGFLHPGLRAEKILYSESGMCKLYDFVPEEIALDLKKLAWDEYPPYQWMSPEYLFLEELTRTGDVWSFGILLWEIFSKGEQPFGDKDRLLVQKCIRQEDPILSKPKACPGGVWTLVLQCWEKRPEERATFQHLSSELFLMTQEKTYEL